MKTQHLGDTHSKTWKEGATCDSCRAAVNRKRAATWQGSPLMGIVPGGSRDTADVRWRRDFGPGLDAYKKAVNEGIQPDHSDLKSVDKAHKRIKSQEAGLKAIKNFSDIDNVKTTPGVNRDV